MAGFLLDLILPGAGLLFTAFKLAENADKLQKLEKDKVWADEMFTKCCEDPSPEATLIPEKFVELRDLLLERIKSSEASDDDKRHCKFLIPVLIAAQKRAMRYAGPNGKPLSLEAMAELSDAALLNYCTQRPDTLLSTELVPGMPLVTKNVKGDIRFMSWEEGES